MTSDKLPSFTKTASVLSLMAVAAILFAASLATGPQTAATTTLTPEEEDVEETQETATENLTEEDRDVNGIEFTPRWGAISTLEPDSIDVLFADCLDDEFAVSSQFVNLNNIINIRQQIVQNAIQVLTITGNNNTVNQVINQAATQITNVNATSPTEIQEIIDQSAQQQGVISGTGNETSLSQAIEQEAAQEANVTEVEDGATDIDQAIEQEAAQEANVTEEEDGATDIDQAIEERAQQQAQVDEQQQQQQLQQPAEGDAIVIDQAIGQNASQQAQVDVEGIPGNSTGDFGQVLGNSTGN